MDNSFQCEVARQIQGDNNYIQHYDHSLDNKEQDQSFASLVGMVDDAFLKKLVCCPHIQARYDHLLHRKHCDLHSLKRIQDLEPRSTLGFAGSSETILQNNESGVEHKTIGDDHPEHPSHDQCVAGNDLEPRP